MPTHVEIQELRRLDPGAKTRPYMPTWQRNYAYAEKVKALEDGTAGDDFFFFSGEMVRYLLTRQNISEGDFNKKLEYADNYFSCNIWSSGCNDGRYILPEPFRKRMEVLTRESLEEKGVNPEEFWCKRNFTREDIDGLKIDMRKDLGNAKVQYPKSEPSDAVRDLLAKIPNLATELLIDPNTKQWRRDTFLIDPDGNFKPVKAMGSIRNLVETNQSTPEEIIATLTTREPYDPKFDGKGRFMRQVLADAKEHKLIRGPGRACSFIPLRPENSCQWSR